jgi:hypothetical protein
LELLVIINILHEIWLAKWKRIPWENLQ